MKKMVMVIPGDPNKKDYLRGCTALHYAASQGSEEILKLLLKAGGSGNIRNNDGETSVEVATGNCRMLLQEQGTVFRGKTCLAIAAL